MPNTTWLSSMILILVTATHMMSASPFPMQPSSYATVIGDRGGASSRQSLLADGSSCPALVGNASGIRHARYVTHGPLADQASESVSSHRRCSSLMAWPVIHPTVAKRFERPARLRASGHRGIDLAAKPGDIIVAPAKGTLRFSGEVAGKSVISIEHDNGYVSTFEPATTAIPVGTTVERNDSVAIVQGDSDHCGSSCVHWGVKTISHEDHYADPQSMVVERSIGLKPSTPSRS